MSNIIFTRLFPILFIFFVSNCYLHNANVRGDMYGIKRVFDFNQGTLGNTLPIRLKFDNSGKYRAKDYLKRKGQNIEVSQELIESYYSDEIMAQFNSSRYFTINSSANIQVRIISSIEEKKAPVISLVAAIGTLGLFPAITRTYGLVEFDIYDSEKEKVLRVYKYPIQHRQFAGFSSIIFGSFFPLFSDSFDHSTNEKTFVIMRKAFSEFEKDFVYDISKDVKLTGRFFAESPKMHALLPEITKDKKEKDFHDRLHESIRSAIVSKGLPMVERNKIDKIINEIQFSQTGLTESNRLAFGKLLNADRIILISNTTRNSIDSISKFKLNFTITCVETNSGRILWSHQMMYVSNEKKDLDTYLYDVAYNLSMDLRRKGIL
jgi:hypothetical protein